MAQRDQRTIFERGLDFIYGEDANLHKLVPPEIGKKHINELLGRHPYHPWDPNMPKDHPCYKENMIFGTCMNDPEKASLELHMKHVSCFHTEKKDLMKCLVQHKRRLREQEQQQQQQSQKL